MTEEKITQIRARPRPREERVAWERGPHTASACTQPRRRFIPRTASDRTCPRRQTASSFSANSWFLSLSSVVTDRSVKGLKSATISPGVPPSPTHWGNSGSEGSLHFGCLDTADRLGSGPVGTSRRGVGDSLPGPALLPLQAGLGCGQHGAGPGQRGVHPGNRQLGPQFQGVLTAIKEHRAAPPAIESVSCYLSVCLCLSVVGPSQWTRPCPTARAREAPRGPERGGWRGSRLPSALSCLAGERPLSLSLSLSLPAPEVAFSTRPRAQEWVWVSRRGLKLTTGGRGDLVCARPPLLRPGVSDSPCKWCESARGRPRHTDEPGIRNAP